MPELVEPMTASLAAPPTNFQDWGTEIKWDGVRAIAFCRAGVTRFQGRRLNDITALFPEVEGLARQRGNDHLVLDGELVAFDDQGVPSFQRIQKRLHRDPQERISRVRSFRATYVIFDLLFENGVDLRSEPYEQRRSRLEDLELAGRSWQTPDYLVGDIEETLEATSRQGLEGLVVKRLDSRYVGGMANRDWLKLKNLHRQEFVVGGWLPGKGNRRHTIGSLLLGYWGKVNGHGEQLRYAGRVGSGFTGDDLESIEHDLAKFSRDDSPFADMPRTPGVEFVNPIRVVEVEFADWTEEAHLRHPVFVGMRRDKDPGAVRRETAEAAARESDGDGFSG